MKDKSKKIDINLRAHDVFTIRKIRNGFIIAISAQKDFGEYYVKDENEIVQMINKTL